MSKEIKCLPRQIDVLKANEEKILVLGGVGSGKTYTMGDLLVKFRSESIHNEICIMANTHTQLRDSVIGAIKKRLEMYGFREDEHWNYMEGSKVFQFLGLNCKLRTYENIDKAVQGLTLHKFLLDEFAFCGRPSQTPMYVYNKLIGRLRGITGVKEVNHDIISRQLFAFSSPDGFNHLHDIWDVNGTPEHKVINMETRDNSFNPDGYYASLVAAYGGEDTPLARQELFGEFVNVTLGKAYYAFNREEHTRSLSRVAGSIVIGMDFNVDPMTATVCQIQGNEIHVIDEVFLRNADTFKMCDALLKKGYGGAYIFPDSTGKNRKTSGKSDFIILREYGFTIKSTRNPLVFDRVNNLNRLLSSNRIIIDPKCKYLIKDLERVNWRGNSLDQKSDPLLTHITDGIGYLAWSLFKISSGAKPLDSIPR